MHAECSQGLVCRTVGVIGASLSEPHTYDCATRRRISGYTAPLNAHARGKYIVRVGCVQGARSIDRGTGERWRRPMLGAGWTDDATRAVLSLLLTTAHVRRHHGINLLAHFVRVRWVCANYRERNRRMLEENDVWCRLD